jgi:type I restriction enzyme, S subunit
MELKKGYKQTEVGVIPEDWEVASLGNLINYTKGFAFSSKDYRSNGVRIIRVSDTTFDSIQDKDEIFIDGDKAKYYAKWSLKEHDLVLSTVGSKPPMYDSIVGRVVIIDGGHDGTLLNQNAVLLRAKDKRSSTQEFLLNVFRTKRYLIYIEAIFRGNANQASITLRDLFQFKLAFPRNVEEKNSIAAALSDVDALIAALERLIAKKRDIKQAAMQELLTGKRRLPGFSAEWEAKKFGEVGRCLRGVSYKGDRDLSPYDTKRTIRLLRSNNIQNAIIEKKDLQFVDSSRVSDHQIMQSDDILVCTANGSKDLVGKAGIFRINDGYDYTFGAFMGCFRTTFSIANPTFVFFLFQTGKYRSYINNLLAGSSINNLKPTDIESLEFNFPLPDEQKSIALALSDMEAEISALEQKRDKTHTLKQGMIQELLTGRIQLMLGAEA